MAIYAEVQLERDNKGQVRALIDMGGHIPQAAPPLYYVDITGIDPAPQVNWWYDINLQTFSDTGPPPLPVDPNPNKRWNAESFWMDTCTPQERAKIWAVCDGQDVPGVTISLVNRYRLTAFRDFTMVGFEWRSLDSEFQTVLYGLEAAGVLDAGRADEMLA